MKKHNRLLAVLLAVCLVCALLVPATALNDVVEEAKNGVVEVIMAYTLDNGDLLELGYGSGFLINDHGVMTCYHCVDGSRFADDIEEVTGKDYNPDRIAYHVVVSGDVTRPATIWTDAYSERDDWAVLQLSNTINGRKLLPLGNSDNTESDTVYALGFPDNSSSDVPKYTQEDVSGMTGIVSKLTTIDGTPVIEHDAQLSGGNSGGPLINEHGDVIGVNYMRVTADGNSYMYCATQINSIKSVLDMLGVEYPVPEDEPEDSETADAMGETEVIAPPPAEEVSEAPTPAPDTPTPAPVDTPAPSLTPSSDNDGGSSLPLILIIAAAVIVVVAVVVIVLVMNNGKKKKQKAVKPQGTTRPPVNTAPGGVRSGGAQPGAPVAPFAPGGQPQARQPQMRQPQAYAPQAESVGATTVLGGDSGVGETTVLGGSAASTATLTRAKNGETTRISRAEFVIGKERSKVDYCVSDNSSVSRRHAKIVARGGKYYVVDMGSTNGTYVNGAKSVANVETEIVSGDKLKFSDEEFTFQC